MAKSRRSYLVTRPSGSQHFVSRDQTTLWKLNGSWVVRIPAYFVEKGTLVCETCSLKDDVLGYEGSLSR